MLSRVWPFETPMDCSPQGFSVHGIFQERLLEWAAISYSRASAQPRDQTRVSWNYWQGNSFPLSHLVSPRRWADGEFLVFTHRFPNQTGPSLWRLELPLPSTLGPQIRVWGWDHAGAPCSSEKEEGRALSWRDPHLTCTVSSSGDEGTRSDSRSQVELTPRLDHPSPKPVFCFFLLLSWDEHTALLKEQKMPESQESKDQ